MAQQTCPGCGTAVEDGQFHACTQDLTTRTPQDVGSEKTQVAPPGMIPLPSRKKVDDTPTVVRKLMDDPSKIINQYVLTEMLGKGGMGEVWKAWDNKLTRWVAIKFLTLDDENSVKRFEREARLAARISHPNIAQIYEFGSHQGRYYIVMEFIDGKPLQKAELELRQVLEVVHKVAGALEHAHKNGIIHRDLKPENIMVTRNGLAYIMDFGLAKSVSVESSISVTGELMGTPVYMAPEQAAGKTEQIGPRSDVYSLGATLYVLLTGKRPFEGATPMQVLYQVMYNDPVPPSKYKPDLPKPVEAIVLKAMEKDPARRYASASELAADLERYLMNLAVEARLPSISTLIMRRIKRNPWPYAAVLALLIAGGIAAYTVLSRPEPQPPQQIRQVIVEKPAVEDKVTPWRQKFQELQKPLVFEGFTKVGDEPVAQLREHLANIPEGALAEATNWFQLQLRLAEAEADKWGQKSPAWLQHHGTAQKMLHWCEAVAFALKDKPEDFAGWTQRIAKLRESAGAVLAYRGEFHLRVSIAPYARVELIRKGKTTHADDTPVPFDGLEIDDYQVVITHPSLKGRQVELRADQLKDGGRYLISGDLKNPDSIKLTGEQ